MSSMKMFSFAEIINDRAAFVHVTEDDMFHLTELGEVVSGEPTFVAFSFHRRYALAPRVFT